MSATIAFIEGVAQLVSQIQQKVDGGTIQLSANEWAKLDRSLEKARSLLAQNDDSEINLKNAGWLAIPALKKNKTLAEHFADQLAALRKGTKPTGRMLLPPKSEGPTLILDNTMTLPSFLKWVREKREAAEQSKKAKPKK